MKYTTDQILLMTAVTSFMGWCLENMWLAVRKGYIDNRNMTFPFLFGYGLAITGFYILAGTPQFPELPIVRTETLRQSFAAYYIFSFVAVSIGEMILGSMVERIFGFRYWDYSGLPMHITRYTSVPTSLGFALIITFFMGECFDPIMTLFLKISEQAQHRAAIILTVVIVWDFFVSFSKMHKTRKLNERWRYDCGHIYSKLSEQRALHR